MRVDWPSDGDDEHGTEQQRHSPARPSLEMARHGGAKQRQSMERLSKAWNGTEKQRQSVDSSAMEWRSEEM